MSARAAALSLVAVVVVAACKPSPRARRCHDNAACAADEYCVFSPELCGKGKRAGTCRPRRRGCDEPVSPVCGCDQRVYANVCAASAAGVDLAVDGGCIGAHPRDFIACGARFCDARRSYCEIVLSDVVELPTDYTCKPLPPACVPDGKVARTCDCFPASTRCRSFCGPLDGGGGVTGFHLTCRL